MLEAVAEAARDAEVFESVQIDRGLVKAHARRVESDCWYQVGPVSTTDLDTQVFVGLHTPDRWAVGVD